MPLRSEFERVRCRVAAWRRPCVIPMMIIPRCGIMKGMFSQHEASPEMDEFLWSKITSITQFAGENWNVRNFETYRYIIHCSVWSLVPFKKRTSRIKNPMDPQHIKPTTKSIKSQWYNFINVLEYCMLIQWKGHQKLEFHHRLNIFGFKKLPGAKRSQTEAWSRMSVGSVEETFRPVR